MFDVVKETEQYRALPEILQREVQEIRGAGGSRNAGVRQERVRQVVT
jgi:hypothetical protein